jgi:hypothetical protein
MIIIRIFINHVPDTWEPSSVWYLAGIETLIEAFLVSVLMFLVSK